MTETPLKPEDQMMQWITGKWISRPIHVATELGVADLLQDGPMGVEKLAQRTETHAPTLYRLLRALTAVGIFAEIEEKVFAITPLAQCLSSETMRPLAMMFLSDWHDRAWSNLDYSVRTGKPGFDRAFGKSAFEWLEDNPEARSVMDQAQGLKAKGFAEAIMGAYSFSDFNSICDVGGGSGAFLIQLLTRYPHIKGIVADLPGAVEQAENAIAKAGLYERCKAVPYDFLREAPPDGDVYFLVNVLHDWEEENCRRILRNISQSMSADSILLVVEYLLEPEPGFSVVKLLDLEVLVMGGGRERTVDEYRTLLRSADLEVSRVLLTSRGPALMECTAG